MELVLPLENKKITDENILKRLKTELSEGERELFRITTDLLPDGNYGEPLVTFTDGRIISVYPSGEGTEAVTVSYSELDGLSIKRMYGNAFLMAIMKSGEKVSLARATYAVTALFNAAVLFVDKVVSGTSTDDAIGGVETA